MSPSPSARIEIGPAPLPQRIDDKIYGHFLESAFFHNVEGGVFDEGSPLSHAGDGPLAGCRLDVIEACRELGLPIVRWPGGNFTSPYRWQDGTGPRDDRPRTLELAWGSEESNRFGTPEFLAWCEAVGTEALLCHSARDVDDAVRWVEYANHAGDTTLTRRRASDGLPESRPVRYWGIGNEVWAPWQMGQRSAGDYVADARQHATFMRAVDPDLRLIAVGWDHDGWLDEVVPGLGDLVDYFSVHHYGASLHAFAPTAEEFLSVVAQPMYFEQAITEVSETVSRLLARHHIDRPIGLALDEWNVRHIENAAWPRPEPGPNGDAAPRDIDPSAPLTGADVNRYSPRTLADALFHAGVFHTLHRASQLAVPVTMANTVNLVNANGLLAVRPDGLVRAATFHVWDLYQNHLGRVPLPCRVDSPSTTVSLRLGTEILQPSGFFRTRPAVLGYLDASATLGDDGETLQLAVINRSPDQAISTRLEVRGAAVPATATMRQIGADVDDLFAGNTMDRPDRIALSGPETVGLADQTYEFPAHSITLLEWPRSVAVGEDAP